MVVTARKVFLIVAALLFGWSGFFHFARPASYLKIMPPYLPWPLALVYISGAAELAGGIGLLIPPVRRQAAWGLVALLIAVLPANIYMATNNIQVTAREIPQFFLWARLPLQAMLIWWVLWCTKDQPRRVS